MSNKTCGECIFYHGIRADHGVCALTEDFEKTRDFVNCCKSFQPKVITNGDKIIAGGNRALAEFHGKLVCDVCEYRYDHRCIAPQGKPLTCVDGIEAWLNAPAESEVEK